MMIDKHWLEQYIKENYIPRAKVEEKIAELEAKRRNEYFLMDDTPLIAKIETKIEVLKELLEK